MISKKNRKHQANSSRAELEIVYPRYVVRHQNRLSNCKSIDLLTTRPFDEKTKEEVRVPRSIDKDPLRRPSQSHCKPSKTKRKSTKLSNGNQTPRQGRNVSYGKLATIAINRYRNKDKSLLASSRTLPSKDMLRHVYDKCNRLLSEYRERLDNLEQENHKHITENEQLRSRLSHFEHCTAI